MASVCSMVIYIDIYEMCWNDRYNFWGGETKVGRNQVLSTMFTLR